MRFEFGPMKRVIKPYEASSKLEEGLVNGSDDELDEEKCKKIPDFIDKK